MKRALVIYGDAEIGNAIANGIVRKGDSEAVRRVAMYQHSPEEWDAMIAKAQYDYGQDRPMGMIQSALLVTWAVLWLAIDRLNEYIMGR